ncbi:hypothetical protein NC651_031144 [Populus alba x Populus x berolinensis]|nr:hypothetical protein NC651_031144 [Populus alba x Populus x berolinensis]
MVEDVGGPEADKWALICGVTLWKPWLGRSDCVCLLFVQPGANPDEVKEEMIFPGSNIVVGPYAGHAHIKEVESVKSRGPAKYCPRDELPEFAILGRSNVGKEDSIDKSFLVNKSWYIVDFPGYGFAKAPDSAPMDWSSFTKGYFLNREALVAVLLLIDASED